MDDNLIGVLASAGIIIVFLLGVSSFYCTRHIIKDIQQRLKGKKEKRDNETANNNNDNGIESQQAGPSGITTVVQDTAAVTSIGSISGNTALPTLTRDSILAFNQSSGAEAPSRWSLYQTGHTPPGSFGRNSNNDRERLTPRAETTYSSNNTTGDSILMNEITSDKGKRKGKGKAKGKGKSSPASKYMVDETVNYSEESRF